MAIVVNLGTKECSRRVSNLIPTCSRGSGSRHSPLLAMSSLLSLLSISTASASGGRAAGSEDHSSGATGAGIIPGSGRRTE